MERIVYRVTLDTHKTGIQKTLQGFETGDTLSRRIVINLVQGSDGYRIKENMVAAMFVTKPGEAVPSINACQIKGDCIIYDVLKEDISEEGVVIMQAKLIDATAEGPDGTLLTPKIALEVIYNAANEDGATATQTFTALEEALARANAYYHTRLTSFYIDEAYVFHAIYADGTEYESDGLAEAAKLAIENANLSSGYKTKAKHYSLMSQSYAVGYSGTRTGENTDNAKYYCEVSQSEAAAAQKNAELAKALRDEVVKIVIDAEFSMDYENGNLMYDSANYAFRVDRETGYLMWEEVN